MVASGLGSGIGDMLSGAGAVGSYIGSGITGGAATKAMGGSFKDGFSDGLAGAAARHSMGAFDPEPELLLASIGDAPSLKEGQLSNEFLDSIDETR